jgi:hypothetical protein
MAVMIARFDARQLFVSEMNLRCCPDWNKLNRYQARTSGKLGMALICLLSLLFLQVIGQCVKPALPKSAVTLDPNRSITHWLLPGV